MTSLEVIRKLLPVLTPTMRKGTCGRVGVIGGSLEYTGAPFYAAVSALKLGADLCHVFCTEEAAPVIKSYSPSLIVHPGWKVDTVVDQLSRMDCLVLGPGLGRDPSAKPLMEGVLKFVETNGTPTVVDADGIFWICEMCSSLPSLPSVVYTPNKGEMDRMSSAFIQKKCLDITNEDDLHEVVKEVSAKIGSTIFMKGQNDLFATAKGEVSRGTSSGGLRRCGGQGDVTAGTLAMFMLWAKRNPSSGSLDACSASSILVRLASKKAFEKIGRSVETSDIIAEVPEILREIDGIH